MFLEFFAFGEPQRYISGWLDKIKHIATVLLDAYDTEAFPSDEALVHEVKKSIMESMNNLLVQNQKKCEREMLFGWEG